MSQARDMTIQGLIEQEWFPNRFDGNSHTIEMVKASREELTNSTFLGTPSFPSENVKKQKISLNDLDDKAEALSPGYIFHSAFCCSTLLARALDFPGKVRALKEPQITMDFADHIRRTGQLPQYSEKIRELLITSKDPEEKTIIKPTNVANNLLLFNTPLLNGSPILFLYGSLRGFLISVLKKGEEGRFMTRRMYSIFSNDPTRFKDIPAKQLATLTDLQIAALTWLLQTEVFEAKIKSAPEGLYASLHCDTFLANQAASLKAINRHFNLRLSLQEVEQLIYSEVLTRNSKQQGEAYDSDQRQSESEQIENEHGVTLDRICQWADGLSLTGKVQYYLSKPLIID